jgi:hypothetical protein
MSKYNEPFESTTDLYKELIEAAGLTNYVNITVLANDTAKDLYKVVKANDLLKHRTGDDIIIVLNEKIFDQLTDEQRLIAAEESLAGIHYDFEKDKIVISKPDVVTYSGVLSKHGFDKWTVLLESIKTLYNTEKQVEDETEATV